jgi:hypothetical protein
VVYTPEALRRQQLDVVSGERAAPAIELTLPPLAILPQDSDDVI